MKKDPHSLRIAHLSDPHFSKITYSPTQFLSKRWVGNLNLCLFRRKSYQTEHLGHIPELLQDLEVEAVCITGDFTSTSLDEEFQKAREFVDLFKMPVMTLPGNHDYYTREAERTKLYYDYFPSEDLKNNRLEVKSLGKGWWYIGLDCAVATPCFFAFGRFLPEVEKLLGEELDKIPQDDKVIIANHYPLYGSRKPSHDLVNSKRLQALLKKYKQVKLYLHGHEHATYILGESQPLVINSGSCAHRPNGTFYLLDLYDTECLLQRLFYKEEIHEGKKNYTWIIDTQKRYPFT